jgi:hypothetical protein
MKLKNLVEIPPTEKEIGKPVYRYNRGTSEIGYISNSISHGICVRGDYGIYTMLSEWYRDKPILVSEERYNKMVCLLQESLSCYVPERAELRKRIKALLED